MFKGIFSGKKVLITGHTGFKGSWASQWLLKLGARIGGYSLYIPSNPSNYEVLGLSKQIEKDYVGDIRDFNALKSAFEEFRPEVVLHFAAQPIVRKSYDAPKLTFDTNVMGMVNILECIRQSSSVKAAVLITSDKCYENVEWEYGYKETDRLGGKDPYSASKACAEIVFSSYFRSFFGDQRSRLATTRAGNVIGGGDWADDRIVPDCMKAWAEAGKVTLRSPRATRPWQHVLEPISGYLWLAVVLMQGREGLNGEAFNFGPSASINQPVVDLVSGMHSIWGKGTWEVDSTCADGKKEASILKLSCDKALHRLHWEPTLSYAETIEFTTRWYMEFYENRKRADMANFTLSQISSFEKLALKGGREWAK